MAQDSMTRGNPRLVRGRACGQYKSADGQSKPQAPHLTPTLLELLGELLTLFEAAEQQQDCAWFERRVTGQLRNQRPTAIERHDAQPGARSDAGVGQALVRAATAGTVIENSSTPSPSSTSE